VVRVAAGALLGPTSFFVLSNFAVWVEGSMYAKTLDGLMTCYVAALPFYRNDLAATGLFLGLAFGVPVLVRRSLEARTPAPVPVPISSRNLRG
jgi:hypothetical protein